MKTKFSITLDEYSSGLLDKAVRVACRMRGAGDDATGTHRRFVLRWIIGAVCAAIIRRGEMPKQLAVELRNETQEEMRQRLAKQLPDGPDDGHGFPPLNRWN